MKKRTWKKERGTVKTLRFIMESTNGELSMKINE